MTYTSLGSLSFSNSDSEVSICSKARLKAYATFKEQYDSLSSDYKKSQFNLVSYKAGLQSVEERLVHYKKNEAVYEEKINILNFEVRLRDNALVEYTKKLEKAEKERDELKLTLKKYQNSSKSLNTLMESQESNKVKTGLGYKAASPVEESFVKSSEMELHTTKPDLMFINEQVESEYVDVVSNVTSSDVKTVIPKRDGEDRLKLKELIELSTKLFDRVFDLEKIKTAQAKKIDGLKKKVKKLERKRRYRTTRMNLFKIGTFRRRSLGKEDASKQGRNLKQSLIFEESNFDVQAMMDAYYELVARLRAEERRRKPLTKAQKRN
uniref:Uncharacterized protein n=1 Tax=Tanacetum cinerariifolium TaxID=118510 RepID=A0A6L2M3J5_TANCI|nr:hypothetical protein [Tanacetum cinerariifolium]